MGCVSLVLSAMSHNVRVCEMFRRLWAPAGWMSWENPKPLLGIGVLDFAGTTVVHMTGGVSALVGAYFIGPRKGRFGPDGKPNPEWDAGHSAMLVCTGTMVLWTGWCALKLA